ncbi:MAG TPA: HAD hydrolase-like protein [Candidatus Sumerlaeota bacterium]|nr:HAD hydrolase-like protein [Candidatus Sumerlaeota bacterium]HPS01980.1 HAD hydrolase-like protein [Candidatus Sumerlaeota bacterium]
MTAQPANPAQPLIDHQPTQDFFIGIDSDGCAFDTMELKHKECFIPNTIQYFGLQAVAKYAREAAEFVNLYSQWRGINRFPAATMTLDLLEDRPEVLARHARIPRMEALREWLTQEKSPSNPTLEAAIKASNGEAARQLQQVLDWSHAVNAAIEDMVEGVSPFPWVRESLEKASAEADLIVVSATPGEALEREWAEHDLTRFVAVIAGQEMGTKTEHLKLASGAKYHSDKVLMIGDAPGDLKAARANHVLFYPIMPGYEDASWKRFHDESLDLFLTGGYKGAYEDALIEEFLASLPNVPPWKK